MKNKEIKLAALLAAVLTTEVLCGSNQMVQAATLPSITSGAIAGVTLSMNHYYENTVSELGNTSLDKQLLTPAKTGETDAISALDYENIGIANVKNYLNIREKAEDSSEIIGMLPKNGGCYIYSIDKNGWAKIKSGDITGYVASEYLVTGDEVVSLAKEVATKVATVNCVTARVREKKSTKSDTLVLIPKGEELDVLDDTDEDWVYVSVDSDKGYISRELVDVQYQLEKATDLTEEAVAASASGTSSVRTQMVAYAKKFIGGKYVYGGTSLETGIDCSAFMMRIYEHFGYNISRTSRSQAAEGKEISLDDVRPGDLIFYDKNGTISHVAMYIGNSKIIHASNPRSGIKISNMYYKQPCKACRFID